MILPCVFVVLFKIGKAPKLRARSLLEIQETRPQERERGKAEVMDEAQRKIFWRKEEEKYGSFNSEGKSRDMVTRKIQSSLEICLGQTIMLPVSFTANPLIISVEASEEEVKMCILLLLFH